MTPHIRNAATIAARVYLCATAFSACGFDNDGSKSPHVPSRRDSLGIEIVDNVVPDAGPRTLWTVDPTPAVDIGMREGPSEYLLESAAGAVRLSDGRIVVAERRALLRYYDSTGKHIKALNLRGEGPGELESITDMVAHRGDSLLITCCSSGSGTIVRGRPLGADLPQTARTQVSVHDAEGRMGREAALSWPEAPARVRRVSGRTSITTNGFSFAGFQGAVSDGSFLTRGSAWPQLEGSPGRRWIQTPYFRVSNDGAVGDTLITLPALDTEEVSDPDDGDRIPIFFRNAPVSPVIDRWMYWGNAESFEIWVFDVLSPSPLRQPSRIIRYSLPNRAADAALTSRYEELMLRRARDREDSLQVLDASRTRPRRPSLPAYEEMHVDADRNLWVRHARLSDWGATVLDPSEPQRWTVIDSSGSVLGEVVTPADLHVAQVGRGWILGIWRDVDDVPHVRIHRLKPD
jgi:hypothetical protein